MILRALLPPGADPLRLGDDEAQARLRELYRAPEASWVRLSMVLSLNGSTIGPDDSSASLSSRADRAVLRAIRAEADVVLMGAGTVRAEGWVFPRSARLAVLTRDGELPYEGLPPQSPAPLVLFPEAFRERVERRAAGAPIELVGLPDATAETIVAALRDRGLSRITCEGGPAVADLLLTADAIDELCLTTSPAFRSPRGILGDPGSHGPLHSPGFRLSGLLLDDDSFLYARWRRER